MGSNWFDDNDSYDDDNDYGIGILDGHRRDLHGKRIESFFDKMEPYLEITARVGKVGLMGLGVGAAVIVGAGLSLVELGVRAIVMAPVKQFRNLGHGLKMLNAAIEIGGAALENAILKRSGKEEKKEIIEQNEDKINAGISSMAGHLKKILGNTLSIITLGIIKPNFEVSSVYRDSVGKRLADWVIGDETKVSTEFQEVRPGVFGLASQTSVEGRGLLGAIEREVKEIKNLAKAKSHVYEDPDDSYSPRSHNYF